jgi:hypothetical protein
LSLDYRERSEEGHHHIDDYDLLSHQCNLEKVGFTPIRPIVFLDVNLCLF